MMRIPALVFLLTTTLTTLSTAFYSIHYQAEKSTNSQAESSNVIIRSHDLVFSSAPSAEQVADIYSRLSNNPPILWEEDVNLPALSLEAQSKQQQLTPPILLEVHGGVLPRSVVPIIRTAAYDLTFPGASTGPTLDEVQRVLATHGLDAVAGKSIEAHGDNVLALQAYLKLETRPVIILHHELPAAHHYILQRRLDTNSSSNNSTGLTEREISQYQICLWVGVGFVLLVLASVCAIANMDVTPDSLLYAKFQSGRTGGDKRD